MTYPSLSSPPSVFIFRPGGDDTANVYTSWVGLYSSLSQFSGLRYIQFDDAIEPCLIPAGEYEMADVIWLGAIRTLAFPLVTLEDGCVIHNLSSVSDVLRVESASSSPALTFDNSRLFAMDRGSSFKAIGSAPFISLPADTMIVFTMLTGSAFLAGTAPVIHLEDSSSGCMLVCGALANIEPATLSGVTGSGIQVIISAGLGQSGVPTAGGQPDFDGNLSVNTTISHDLLSGLDSGDAHPQYLLESNIGTIDHGSLSNLNTGDPHPQYRLESDDSSIDHSTLANLTSGDPHPQYRLESDDESIDHAALANLTSGDPHTQYLLESAVIAPASGSAVGSTSAPTTTSASFVTIPEMSVTLTSSGGPLSCTFLGAFNVQTNDDFSIAIFIDDSEVTDSEQRISFFGGTGIGVTPAQIESGPGMCIALSAQSAGEHTVTARWKRTAGTARAIGVQRQLIVSEII